MVAPIDLRDTGGDESPDEETTGQDGPLTLDQRILRDFTVELEKARARAIEQRQDAPDVELNGLSQWLVTGDDRGMSWNNEFATPTTPANSNDAEDAGDNGDGETDLGISNRYGLLSEQSIELLRSTRDRQQRLIDDAYATSDAYSLHIAGGERLLAMGRYFDAEAKFAAALSSRPGDATAQVGRLHAQIGGGLLSSAARNLRVLVAESPIVIGVRYGPSLLPAPNRLDAVRERLLGQRDVEKRSASAQATDAALLDAYLAYQLDDRARMIDARDRFEALAKRVSRSEGTLDIRLASVRRQVWLADDGGKPDSAEP